MSEEEARAARAKKLQEMTHGEFPSAQLAIANPELVQAYYEKGHITRENGWDYLGDGVYYNNRVYEIELVAFDGITVLERIVLDVAMVNRLHSIVIQTSQR